MKHFWLLLVGILFVVAKPVQAQAPSASKKPFNILFIAIDDLNNWVGVLGGHPQAKTPHLDRLAKKSVLFKRAYCAAPACNPSRTALLTGLRPSTTGVYHNDQPWRPALPDAVTLPAYLRQNGYLVWGGGKIFHGGYNDAQAWAEYFTGKAAPPQKSVPLRGAGGNLQWSPLHADDSAMPDTQMTDWAIKKLQQNHDQPFFMAVGYVKPHLEWSVPKKYFDMHPLDQIQLPKVLANDLDDIPPAGVKMAKPEGDHKKIVAGGLWKEAVQAYLACGTFMDAQVGRLIDALEKSGQWDNTIVILWSDHGWSHGQKQHWRKFSLWEQDCQVLLLASVPGITSPGGECLRPVNLLDLFPTMIELCSLPEKKGLEGTSLAPLLKNPQATRDLASITTHGFKNHSIRTLRWRYIQYKDGSEELYDHSADPLEWKNLANDPEHVKLKEQLAAQLPRTNTPDAERKKGKE